MPGESVVKKLHLNGISRLAPELYVSPTHGNVSGYHTFKLKVGDATYRAITFAIKCDAEVVGKSVRIGGIHYLKTEVLNEYIGNIRLTASGSTMQEYDISELLIKNSFHEISFGPVYTGFAFPGEFTFSSEAMTDAFALGTKGMRDLTLHIKPNKTTFDETTMEIVVMPYAVDRVKPVGFTFTTERISTTFAGIGNHTYWDLPISDDIRSFWLKADGLKYVKLTVDGTVMFDMDVAQYQAFLIEKRRNVDVLEGQFYIDVFAEREPRTIAALDLSEERKRDARIKLEVTTTMVSTPVEFIIEHADLYDRIR
ncbi:hypothetical protein JI58_02245 [Marinosulfonomonas sp. PRT-SC04]|nr:hypothetical protein JI58_02245 [Marinosulfonomonas sp. PRT-SC04]